MAQSWHLVVSPPLLSLWALLAAGCFGFRPPSVSRRDTYTARCRGPGFIFRAVTAEIGLGVVLEPLSLQSFSPPCLRHAAELEDLLLPVHVARPNHRSLTKKGDKAQKSRGLESAVRRLRGTAGKPCTSQETSMWIPKPAKPPKVACRIDGCHAAKASRAGRQLVKPQLTSLRPFGPGRLKPGSAAQQLTSQGLSAFESL